MTMNDYVLKPGMFIKDKYYSSIKLVLSIGTNSAVCFTCLTYSSGDWDFIEHYIEYLLEFYVPIDDYESS